MQLLNDIIVRRFLVPDELAIVPKHSYSPDLSATDIFLFCRIKKKWQPRKDIIEKSQEILLAVLKIFLKELLIVG